MLIPVMSFSAELPDQNYLCITEYRNEIENPEIKESHITSWEDISGDEIEHIGNRYIFNPSKGFKEFSSEEFKGACSRAHDSYSCPYVYEGNVGRFLVSSISHFFIDTEHKNFNYIDIGSMSTASEFGKCSIF